MVFDNLTAKKITRLVSKHIHYIYVDLEKKAASKKKKELVNIEHVVKDNIHPSKIKYLKSNDVTVNAIENFLNSYYSNDPRGIGGKKTLIIGSGNIGSKLALRLVESGSEVFISRRNNKKSKIISDAINLIKPKFTKAICKNINHDSIKLDKYDVIIGCANTIYKTSKKNYQNIKKDLLTIDVGKGVFDKNFLNYLAKKKIIVYRINIDLEISSHIDLTLKKKLFFNEKLFGYKKNFKLVKQGVLGSNGDIIVDNVNKPTQILGVCNKDGEFKKISYKKMLILRSKIIKNI